VWRQINLRLAQSPILRLDLQILYLESLFRQPRGLRHRQAEVCSIFSFRLVVSNVYIYLVGTRSSPSRSQSLDLANTGWQSKSVHRSLKPKVLNHHEGRILSNTLIGIRADPNNAAQADMGQTPTLSHTSESFLASNSEARPHSRQEPECSVSVIQKQSNAVLHGFSRVNWDRGEFSCF